MKLSQIIDNVNEEFKETNNSCSKCGKIPATITYKDKKYCTWYCAKKN